MKITDRSNEQVAEEIRGTLEDYHLEPERFVRLVREALATLVSEPTAADATSQLTQTEIEELAGVGLDVETSRGAHVRAIERAAARMTAILAGSRTVEETADLLGVTPGRVRQMLGEDEHALFGIKSEGSWRVPSFQFAGNRPVRNLRHALGALPRDFHPVEFFNWFTRPDPALRVEGRSVSPQAWLESGGDPGPVAIEAAQL